MKPEMPEPESPSSPRNGSTPVAEYPLRSILDATATTTTSSSTTSSPSVSISSAKRLHIANIPFRWREDDLEQLFSPFGSVAQVEIVRNERGSKGFGFVTFLDGEAADQAIDALSGTEIQGRTIAVNEASKRRRPLPMSLAVHQRAREWQPERRQIGQQGSTELGALLLKQKQVLAQQQLQQFLFTQQQTDMIASALGLPTSNLGGLLAGSLPYSGAAGSLPYPGAAAMSPCLNIDPIALQLQSLQQQQHQLQAASALLPAQQYAAYGQMPTVSTYSAPSSYNVAGRMPEIGPQQATPLNNQVAAMYIASEMAGSSSAMHKGRTTLHRNDGSSQRFNPY